MGWFAVIVREMQVQAQTRVGAWARVLAALGSILLTVSVLPLISSVGTGFSGATLFAALACMAWTLAAFAGIALTADSLSRERREDTLGLLFLTPLRGVDVVLGKLFAHALGSGYALLAVFPCLAVAFPVGGVTVGEFWRTQLVLLETLGLAVACGLWASARNTELIRSWMQGFGMFAALTLGTLPVIWKPGWPSASPLAALLLAQDSRYRVHASQFWATTVVVAFVGVALIAIASRKVVRHLTLASSARSTEPEPVEPAYRIPPSLHTRPRSAARCEMGLDWLLRRDAAVSPFLWAGIAVAPVWWVAQQVAVHLNNSPLSTGLWFAAGSAVPILSGLLLATGASRILSEPRRSGELELLLCTPITDTDLAQAAWHRIRRTLTPAITVAYLSWLVICFLPLLGLARSNPWYLIPNFVGVLEEIVSGVAICRLALWSGLSRRKPLAVIGLPLAVGPGLALVFKYLASAVVNRVLPTTFQNAIPISVLLALSLPHFLVIGYQVAIFFWAKRRLNLALRAEAAA